MIRKRAAVAYLLAIIFLFVCLIHGAEAAMKDEKSDMPFSGTETAYFAAGCFWGGVQSAFDDADRLCLLRKSSRKQENLKEKL